MNNENLLKEVISQFDFVGEVIQIRPYGSGHINDTYLVEFKIKHMGVVPIILQRMNTNIFKNPVQLMENILNVTTFLRKKIIQYGGDPERETLTVILNKNGKLTDEEMNVVKQHPLVGAAMTQRFPEGITTEKLNQYSYEICRHHHERYDGSGYPDGLKGNEIPMCAQVVGIVDAYDALINDRPYKRKYEPEEAIQMISNGECGAFSNQLMQCFQEAAKQQNWLKRQN